MDADRPLKDRAGRSDANPMRARSLLLAVVAALGLATMACDPAPTTGADHWFCLGRTPQSAADYRTALNHHDARWQGGDGATPAALPGGKVAWIFGDTLYGNVGADGSLNPGWGMAHGSMLIQTGDCFDPFYSAASSTPTSLVPQPPAGELRWPGSGWVSRDGTRLHLTVSRVRLDPTAAFGFTSEYGEIATFDYPSLTLRSIERMPSPSDASASNWGSAFDDGGYAYLYATHGFSHYAARVPDDASDPATGAGWEYWTGSAWSSSPSAAGAMDATRSPLAGIIVSWTASGYVMTAKSAGNFSQDVSAWTSASPAGPWTPLGAVADLSYLPAGRTYGGHAATQLPGGVPVVVWSVSPTASGSNAGAGIGVAAPSRPLG